MASKQKNSSNSKSAMGRKHLEREFEKEVREIVEGSRKILSSVARKYLETLVDASRGPKVGIPTAIGGWPGRTQVFRTKVQGNVVVGTLGLGFVLVGSPQDGGPYLDRLAGVYTDAAYAANTLVSTPATAGINAINWPNAPVNAVGQTSRTFSYRLVGLVLKVKPDGSMTGQNGRALLFEDPNHANQAGLGLTFDNVGGRREARMFSAVEFGRPQDEICLNYHPIEDGGAGQVTSPFDWNSHNMASATSVDCPLVFAFAGAAGAQFQWSLHAVWEARGSLTQGRKLRPVDSRGMDLVLNACYKRNLSGWVGKPDVVEHSYLADVWDIAKTALAPFEKAAIKGLEELPGVVSRTFFSG